MCVIKLTDFYTYLQFKVLCESINNTLDEIINVGRVAFDLSDVKFIDPFGMISIIGACRHMFNKHDVQSSIVLPSGPAGRYMSRAGFSSIPRSHPFIEVKKSSSFLETLFSFTQNSDGILTFFKSEREISAVTKQVMTWMQLNGYNEDEQNTIATFISEMVQNVCQHSETPQSGVLCTQAYKTKNGKPFLAWAIGDAGVGIRQSLLNAGISTVSDSQAIQEVLKGKSSIQDDITRGNGFPRLFQAAKDKSATLFIHSNHGIYGWNTRDFKNRKTVNNDSSISGTTVSFIIG